VACKIGFLDWYDANGPFAEANSGPAPTSSAGG
jgi:hypothetical protein